MSRPFMFEPGDLVVFARNLIEGAAEVADLHNHVEIANWIRKYAATAKINEDGSFSIGKISKNEEKPGFKGE